MLWIRTYFYNNYLSLWFVIRFPKNETRTKAWLQKCRMPGNMDVSSACLCLKHFTKEDIRIVENRHLLISPQLSYIVITSCIQEFWDYVQSTLLYGLRIYLKFLLYLFWISFMCCLTSLWCIHLFPSYCDLNFSKSTTLPSYVGMTEELVETNKKAYVHKWPIIKIEGATSSWHMQIYENLWLLNDCGLLISIEMNKKAFVCVYFIFKIGDARNTQIYFPILVHALKWERRFACL